MAERSTAAVDVADNSGDDPLTAKADATTADGAQTQSATDTSSPDADSGQEAAKSTVTKSPELRSGTNSPAATDLRSASPDWTVSAVGGRSTRSSDEPSAYTSCPPTIRGPGRSWRPHVPPRCSAIPGSSRALDAVEENDLVYVVHEWLPDAIELTALLAAGPLEPYDAYQLVSQVSQAMAAAHREAWPICGSHRAPYCAPPPVSTGSAGSP